jgi:ParB-like chromosome segregation protein Spo0J
MAVPQTKVVHVPVKKIFVRDDRKRTFTIKDDKMQLIVNDVQLTGFLEPIGVRPALDNKYELLYGRRRLWIAKHLGYETIPAMVLEDVADEQVDFITFSENVHRYQMKPGEWIQAVANLARAREKAGTVAPDKYAAGGSARAENAVREGGRFAKGSKKTHKNGDLPKASSLPPPASSLSLLAGAEPATPQQEKPRAFAEELAKKTGQHRVEAFKDVKLANTLTSEQLKNLDEANITRDGLEKIGNIENEFQRNAVIIAFCACEGTESVDGLIADLVGSGTVVKLEATVQENSMPDSQWLESYCSNVRQYLQDTKTFDRDALLYRATRTARAKFAQSVKGDSLKAKAKGYHPFGNMLLRLAFIEHPGSWYVCYECTGDNVDKPKCDVCHGTGYTLKVRDMPRPRN